jgi:hypothetical protein
MKRALVLVVGIVAIVPLTAKAHEPWPNWYPFFWDRNAIIWFADHDFDNGRVAAAGRDSILLGHGRWNAEPPPRGYNWNGFRYDIVYAVPGEFNVNGFFWDPIAGEDGIYADIYAWVQSSEFAGWFHSFDIRFNSAVTNWNMKANAAPGLFEVDLLSVAVHEAGHGMGDWIHWDEGGAPALCKSNDTRHTMCATTWTGTVWWRSLEKHDRHTFGLAY